MPSRPRRSRQQALDAVAVGSALVQEALAGLPASSSMEPSVSTRLVFTRHRSRGTSGLAASNTGLKRRGGKSAPGSVAAKAGCLSRSFPINLHSNLLNLCNCITRIHHRCIRQFAGQRTRDMPGIAGNRGAGLFDGWQAAAGFRFTSTITAFVDGMKLEPKRYGFRKMSYDLMLRSGRVIDPSQGLDATVDVAFLNGKVAAIGPRLKSGAGTVDRDVSGLIVTPGLVDLHTHVYWGGTSLGVDAEAFGRACGVTTVVDTGSAGPGNFAGFRQHVCCGRYGQANRQKIERRGHSFSPRQTIHLRERLASAPPLGNPDSQD